MTATGRIQKIDDFERVVIMTSRERIPIDGILSVESTIFQETRE